MDRKLNEFLALTQRSRTVSEYAHIFNNLCQYAGYHVASDPKKQDRFRRGLSTKLKDRLALARPANYNDLVNMAIVQEDAMAAHRAEKKRKAPMPPSGAPSQRYRVAPSFQRPAPTSFRQQQARPPPQGCWVIRPVSQQNQSIKALPPPPR